MTTENGKKLDRIIELLQRQTPLTLGTPVEVTGEPATFDEEQLFARFRARLLKDSTVLQVLAQQPVLEISVRTERIQIDGSTLRGRLAQLIHKGFFDEVRNGQTAFNELQRLGVKVAKPTVYSECDKLTTLGFLSREADGYQVVPNMKINLVRA